MSKHINTKSKINRLMRKYKPLMKKNIGIISKTERLNGKNNIAKFKFNDSKRLSKRLMVLQIELMRQFIQSMCLFIEAMLELIASTGLLFLSALQYVGAT